MILGKWLWFGKLEMVEEGQKYAGRPGFYM